jgi:hypothetical protein
MRYFFGFVTVAVLIVGCGDSSEADFPVPDAQTDSTQEAAPEDGASDSSPDGGPDGSLDADLPDVTQDGDLPETGLDVEQPDGPDDVGLDAVVDVGPDVLADVGLDAVVDVGPDVLADVGLDAVVDVGPDVLADVGLDAVVDVGPDVLADVGPSCTGSLVVISQLFGGGGNANAPYTHDFIEIFNRGSTCADLTGWSVQYASPSGGTWSKTDLVGQLEPGRYLLVQEASSNGCTGSPCGSPLPPPDIVTSPGGWIAMSATAGKVALVRSTTALSGACPSSADILDFVGYGSSTQCAEGTPTVALSNTWGARRKQGGCQDTGNNQFDFETPAPTPRNGSTVANVCP